MKKFTLIELLMVIAIIGILVSILLPSIAKAREYTKRAVCKSNIAQVVKATFSYTVDSNGHFPKNYHEYPGNNWRMTITEPYNFTGHQYTKIGRLLKDGYLGSLQVAYCPSNKWQADANSAAAGLALDYESNVPKWDLAIQNPSAMNNFVNVNYEWRKGVDGPDELAKAEPTDAFIADMFFEWYGEYSDTWFHSIYGKSYWNVGYVDGSVKAKTGLTRVMSWPQWNDVAQWNDGYFSE
ncbi:MAG: prepilin-type N-terminal cleavage/methylation domain-containing protein [Lentisphaeraceae bacterium]|nr:prepilin-type N-terminal cleavage/methylation domain-containing protein [Lentisphaeraceae bacterium]